MASGGREIARMIEEELLTFGVEKYSFDHTSKHGAVTWWLSGQVKFYTFPQKTDDGRMKKNIRADIRRWCKAMKAGPCKMGGRYPQ